MCTYPDVWGLRVALEIGVQSLTFYVGLGIPRAGGVVSLMLNIYLVSHVNKTQSTCQALCLVF